MKTVRLSIADLVLLALAAALWAAFAGPYAAAALAQKEPPSLKCEHPLSRLSTFDKLRLIPAEILSVEGELVEWKATGADEIRLGTSALSDATEYAVTKGGKVEKVGREVFAKSAGKKGEWSLLMCSRCKALLAARRDG